MLTREAAYEIAYKEIRKDCYDECAIMDEFTREEEFGYMFFYQSKRFLETRDERELLFGNAPIIVNKFDGSVHVTGTADTPEFYIRKYREELKRKQQNL